MCDLMIAYHFTKLCDMCAYTSYYISTPTDEHIVPSLCTVFATQRSLYLHLRTNNKKTKNKKKTKKKTDQMFLV